MSLSTVGLYENGLHLEKKWPIQRLSSSLVSYKYLLKIGYVFFPPMDESLDCFLSMFKKHLSVMINKGD